MEPRFFQLGFKSELKKLGPLLTVRNSKYVSEKYVLLAAETYVQVLTLVLL